MLIKLHNEYRNKWKKIVTFFDRRTDIQLKNRYSIALKKITEKNNTINDEIFNSLYSVKHKKTIQRILKTILLQTSQSSFSMLPQILQLQIPQSSIPILTQPFQLQAPRSQSYISSQIQQLQQLQIAYTQMSQSPQFMQPQTATLETNPQTFSIEQKIQQSEIFFDQINDADNDLDIIMFGEKLNDNFQNKSQQTQQDDKKEQFSFFDENDKAIYNSYSSLNY